MATPSTIIVGKPDIEPSAPSHVAGVQEGNRPELARRNAGRNGGRNGAEEIALASARRATSINPEDRAPIDPSSPNLGPA